MKMTDVMIDIETLGTTPGCSILSIAAVPFNTPAPLEYFYQKVDSKTCVEMGLHIDSSTVDWWSKQPADAYAEAFSGTTHITIALSELNAYLMTIGEVRVWGNGASFDVPILEAAMSKCGLKPKWKYFNSLCYRTLKNLYPAIPAEKNRMKHSALEDAKTQAEHASRIMQFIQNRKG
jgi:DNA polymerase III epsilon subunit-like protein